MDANLDWLHDGHLNGIEIEDRNTIKLHCTSLHGKLAIVRVTGVTDFYVNNLRIGNIIMFAESIKTVDEIGDRALCGLAQCREIDDAARSYADRMRKKEADAPTRYFLLQSSYGCDLAIVYCGDVVVSTDTPG